MQEKIDSTRKSRHQIYRTQVIFDLVILDF